MKKLIVFIALFFVTTIAFCDSVEIIFDCYPKEIQEGFAKRGYKVDLSANDRTDGSWGFVESKGSHYYIHTYFPIEPEEFSMITEVVWEATTFSSLSRRQYE